jgi:alcohol dehydrogenase
MEVRKFSIPEIIIGRGSIGYAGSYALQLGGKRVFVVSDAGLERCGWVERLLDILHGAGLQTIYFNQVQSNPRDYHIHAGADLYRGSNADVILALGGGSPLDTAKGIATVVANGGRIQDYEGANRITRPLPPLVLLPSTAGSGSDISQFAIITDTQRRVKMSLISRSLTPNVSIIDPDLLDTADDHLLITSALDALAHAVESYLSPLAHPLTETQALKAIWLITRHLPQALLHRHPSDLERLCLASTAAGMSFSNASLGACHAIAHSLGGVFDTPHGEVHPVLLPHVLRFNLPACTAKMAEMGEVILSGRFASDTETAEAAISWLENFFADLGTASRLSQIIPHGEDFQQICTMAAQDACLLTNPRPATAEDLFAICQEAW